MTSFFTDSMAQDVNWLAWILLHTIWQGAVIAAVLWLGLKCIGQTRSNARYVLGCLALCMMVAAPIVTGIAIRHQIRVSPASFNGVSPSETEYPTTSETQGVGIPHSFATPLSTTSGDSERANSVDQFARSASWFGWTDFTRVIRLIVERYSVYLVVVWLLGVAISTGRLVLSYRAVGKLRESAVPITDGTVSQKFTHLIQRLSLDPRIRLFASGRVIVPTVLGWLRPIVLFPLSYTSGFSPEQIEALLAHELAHIKRHDYLVNLLQSFVETVLFFHPSVWWINTVIRDEREHCCDEIALGLISNRRLYAESLIQLAQFAAGSMPLAMSAGGGSLICRIERILKVPSKSASNSGTVIALTTAFLLALVIVPAYLTKAAADQKDANPAEANDKKQDQTNAQPNTGQADAKPQAQVANDASKPAQPKKPFDHSGGQGGSEIFYWARMKAVAKELDLNEEAIAKIEKINDEYFREVTATMPLRGTLTRMIQRPDGSMTVMQEATAEQLPVFKATAAKFRPRLKATLTEDQYRRLLEITWQAMGTAAFADEEMVDALKLTKDQQQRVDGYLAEFRKTLFEQMVLTRQSNPDPRELVSQTQQLEAEKQTKVTESLSKEQFQRLTELTGKPFDLTLLKNNFQGPVHEDDLWVEPVGRGAIFLRMIENEAIQNDIGLSQDAFAKIKSLVGEFKTASQSIAGPSPKLLQLSDDERKAAWEKNTKAKNLESEKFLTRLKGVLTSAQSRRLQEIHLQQMGNAALNDSEVIKELSLSKEQRETIKAIRTEYDKKISQLRPGDPGSLKIADERDRRLDAKIDATLTAAQRDKYVSLLGNEFDLIEARLDDINSTRGNRRRQPARQGRRSGVISRLIAYPRRPLFALVENPDVQTELGLSNDAVAKLRALAEEARTATADAVGGPLRFQDMSPEGINPEQSCQARDKVEALDRSIMERFLPKLKELLTADQFNRLKQINWQSRVDSPMSDPQVIAALSVSRDQQNQIEAINTERAEQLREYVYRVDINTIFGRSEIDTNAANTNANTTPRGQATGREQIEAVANKFRERINQVLTKEQQEKLEELKGKPFEPRRPQN